MKVDTSSLVNPSYLQITSEFRRASDENLMTTCPGNDDLSSRAAKLGFSTFPSRDE